MCDSNMSYVWDKEILQDIKSTKVNSFQYTSYPHGSGDGGPRCCRLCGGRERLQTFCGNERYDRLVYQCFMVVVSPSDSMICEQCVSHLRTTDRFKALVDAAFEQASPSESNKSLRTCVARNEPETLTIKYPTDMKTESRFIINQKPKNKILKEKKCVKLAKNTPIVKRMNIACSICKQRYPVMMPVSSQSDFVCARCKNNRDSVALRRCKLPTAVTLDRNRMGDQGDGKKHRLSTGTTLKLRKCESILKYHCEPCKYKCSQCTEHFIHPQRLAEHTKNVHSDSSDAIVIVGVSDLKMRSNLEKHLKTHTGQIHQCDVCLEIFKNKPALQTHLTTHKNKQCYKDKYAGGEKNNRHRL